MPRKLNVLEIEKPQDRILNFGSDGRSVLKLKNTSGRSVAYKIKTTAPKAVLVRPACGVVKSGKKEEVHIVKTVPPGDGGEDFLDSQCRFLIQALARDTDILPTADEWLAVDKTKIEEARLGVTTEKPTEKPTLIVTVSVMEHGVAATNMAGELLKEWKFGQDDVTLETIRSALASEHSSKSVKLVSSQGEILADQSGLDKLVDVLCQDSKLSDPRTCKNASTEIVQEKGGYTACHLVVVSLVTFFAATLPWLFQI